MKTIVETKTFKINDSIKFHSGKTLDNIEIAYETYGKLNKNKDNAILLLHALTGDAHAAFYHKDDKKAGWWDDMVGPNKAFDTNKYFIICSNMLGGCSGTTGPSSINPKTNAPYGLEFPVFTIEEVVKVQKYLIDYFGIQKLCVAGGSMGGMQAMEWATKYPNIINRCILIATTPKLSTQAIAFNAVGRNAIVCDTNWNNGNYYNSTPPNKGLSIARMIGHITYLCEESMQNKFARRFQNSLTPNFNFDIDFEVESYLAHQGEVFVDRFDANSYLYITKAVDYFDLAAEYGTLEEAFSKTNAKFLVISFTSDWLFPPNQSKEIVNALVKNKKDVSYCEIESPYGHDAFLLEFQTQTSIIKSFLKEA